MKIKRFTACMLSFLLITIPAVSAPGSVQYEEKKITAAEPETPDEESYKKAIADLRKTLEELDPSELASLVMTIAEVGSSEEFEALMQYTEVQELARTALISAVEFVYSDQELTAEILKTLGMDEEAADLIRQLLELSDGNKEAILGLIENVKLSRSAAEKKGYAD